MTRARKATGQALELEVLKLFRDAGFRAERNSRIAKPRQTDILAQGHGLTLLIEVKDRRRVVDVNDIDGLRVRLGRTTSAISRSASKEIASDRTREILVFVASEIDLLRASKARLLNLIAKKRRELRANGQVWFRTGEGGEYLDISLPRATMEFVAGQAAGGYFCSQADFAHAAFSVQIPDTGWGSSSGDSVRLNLSLALSAPDEFKDLFGYLHDTFGLSSNGAFTRGFRKHHNVPKAALNSKTLGSVARSARRDALHDVLDKELRIIVEIRNKLVHGQWVYPLNNDATAVENDKYQAINKENFQSLQFKFSLIGHLADAIHDLVVNPITFERDFEKHFQKLLQVRTNLVRRNYSNYEEQLVERRRAARSAKVPNI